MDHGEDCGVRADPQAQRSDHDCRKSRVAPESTESIPEILADPVDEVVQAVAHVRRFLLLVFAVWRGMGFSVERAKLRRYLLGVTRNRRSKARRNESAPLNPTDSATLSIDGSPAER